MILENSIKQASQFLKNHNISSYELDAEIILSNIMKVTREFLIVNNHLNISKSIIKKYNLAIRRRIKREPIAYIIGKKEFWSEDFVVNNATHIPRPETELLIDISAKAIQTAKVNSKNLNLHNHSKFKIFDLNKYNIGRYDLIVSNPPYIPSKDIKNLSKDIINHEPIIALDGGLDGLDLIKKVIYKSNHLLKRHGLLAIEIGFNQYHKVSGILRRSRFREIAKEYDYNRNVRCIISTKIGFF